jgi:hypothetical protein
MSLNQIQLKPQMLAGLYNNKLLQTNASTQIEATTVPENEPPRYLGKNQKKIIVIVSHPNLPFLPDSELALLSSILAACKLSIADIAIVNNTRMETNAIQKLILQEGQQVLLFGIPPLAIDLPINFPQFQLQQFDKRTYLYSPSLAELEKNKTAKLNLWNCLKTLFGI